MMRTITAALLSALAVTMPATAVPSTTSIEGAAPAATCSTAWGSTAETKNWPGLTEGSVIRTGRAGQHTCYDRFVLDLGAVPKSEVAYSARYVSPLVNDASGAPVSMRGGAVIELRVGSPTYDANGRQVWRVTKPSEAVDVTGYRTLRQVNLVTSWEGMTQIGVGVRARLPFRVTLTTGSAGQTLLVLDVAHTW